MPVGETVSEHTIDSHFDGRSAQVRGIYESIVAVSKEFGPVTEEPKKTSIHLANRTAFAGIATRKDALILTIKSATDIPSPRILKREQVSANRWHLELRLDDPGQVDGELREWLEKAYRISG